MIVLIMVAAAMLLVAWLVTNPSGSKRAAPPPDYAGRKVLRVLFIGNSLTEANDLPGMVAAISLASKSGPVIEATAQTLAGAHLGDHWDDGAGSVISERGWDFVVLQQGPSSLAESRRELLEFARVYDPAIREAGARPAFYMVWPAEANIAGFDRVCESYRLAAKDIGGLLLPAGEAWRCAWRREPSMPLYGPDRFHPSPAGSYLAALVICAALTGQSPLELVGPDQVTPAATGLSPAQVGILKEAAQEALGGEAVQ